MSTSNDTVEIEFCITDTGIGIESELIEKLGTPFFMVNQNEHIGTGLGLSICKKLIEMMKSRLIVESTFGKVCS